MPVRVLVCGSRSWNDYAAIDDRIEALPAGAVLVHGGALGADTVADNHARRLGIPVEVFPVTSSDWDRFGRRAGVLRNLTMLDSGPDLVIAFWDGKSRGTEHTITEARKRGIPVEVHGASDVVGAQTKPGTRLPTHRTGGT